jgi:hypothetical protein
LGIGGEKNQGYVEPFEIGIDGFILDAMGGRSSVRLSVFVPLTPGLNACPRCEAPLPWVRRTEVWVEQTLEGGWMAAYRLMVRAGRLLVAEVRLVPDHPPGSSRSGRWSEDPSAVPPEGVPGRALRALRLKVPLERFPRFLRNLERDPKFAKQLLGGHGIRLGSKMARRRPGRAGRSDSFYLAWAVAYVDRLAAGSRRPVKDLAEHPPVVIRGYRSDDHFTSQATVRDIIHQARKRGLLTTSPSGRPGGELTAKAERMMKRPVAPRRRRRS